MSPRRPSPSFFFFNDTATTEIYTLSLHDALPILPRPAVAYAWVMAHPSRPIPLIGSQNPTRIREAAATHERSEEHTSELQSLTNLVCRLLLEKKKTTPVYPLTVLVVNQSPRSPGP